MSRIGWGAEWQVSLPPKLKRSVNYGALHTPTSFHTPLLLTQAARNYLLSDQSGSLGWSIGFYLDPKAACVLRQCSVLPQVACEIVIIELLTIPLDCSRTTDFHEIAISEAGGLIKRNGPHFAPIASAQGQHGKGKSNPHCATVYP